MSRKTKFSDPIDMSKNGIDRDEKNETTKDYMTEAKDYIADLVKAVKKAEEQDLKFNEKVFKRSEIASEDTVKEELYKEKLNAEEQVEQEIISPSYTEEQTKAIYEAAFPGVSIEEANEYIKEKVAKLKFNKPKLEILVSSANNEEITTIPIKNVSPEERINKEYQINVKLTEKDSKDIQEINKTLFFSEAPQSMIGRMLIRKGIEFYKNVGKK